MYQCVKALIYVDQDDLLDINSRNDFGDTALHLAAKWGYGTSCSFLLCFSAELYRASHLWLPSSYTSPMASSVLQH